MRLVNPETIGCTLFYNRLSEDDENSHILFCTACRREIGLWNFHRLKGIDEVSCQLPLKDVNPSVDESLECETMSVSEEQSTVQGTVQTRDISDVEKLQYTGMGATDSGVCDTENETTSRGTTAENVLTEEEKMDEDVSAITAGCERRESTMDTSECVSDTSERIVGGEKCVETVDTGDEPPRNTPSADSTCSATVSVEDGSSTTHDKKRTHSPMLVVDSEDKSVAGATSEQTEKHDNSKYKFEREHPFMTPTHPSATGLWCVSAVIINHHYVKIDVSCRYCDCLMSPSWLSGFISCKLPILFATRPFS